MKNREPENNNRDIYWDPMENEKGIEEYIERRRREFHKEWYRYLAGACE